MKIKKIKPLNMPNDENLYKEIIMNKDDDALFFYKLIKNIEIENNNIEEEIKQIQNIIKHTENEKIILDNAIKEKLKKEEKPEWMKILLKKK